MWNQQLVSKVQEQRGMEVSCLQQWISMARKAIKFSSCSEMKKRLCSSSKWWFFCLCWWLWSDRAQCCMVLLYSCAGPSLYCVESLIGFLFQRNFYLIGEYYSLFDFPSCNEIPFQFRGHVSQQSCWQWTPKFARWT